MKTKNIDNIRPVLSIEDNLIISRIGSYSKVYELKLPPIFSMGEEDYERCAEEFTSIFNVLPEYTVVHKMDIYTKKKFESARIKGEGILTEGYKLKFNERPVLEHKTYLIISKTSNAISKKTSLNSLIFKNNLVSKELLSEQNQKFFLKSLRQIESMFKESYSFDLNSLNEDEIIHLCNQYENLNFGGALYSSDIFQDNENTMIGTNHLSCVAINSLKGFPSEYEDVYIDKTYSTDSSSIKFSLFHPIGLGFKENHIVNQIFIKTSQEDVKTELRGIDNYNRTFSFTDKANYENLSDSLDYQSLIEKGYTPLRYHCNILIWDKDKGVLDSQENQIFSNLNKIKIQPNIAHNEILPLYWSCYPGNASDIGYIDQTFFLLDRQAAALNIYETTNDSNISDFGIYLSERVSGAPIYVDISDLPIKKGITNNRNKMIFGPSGSGKSFFTNHLLNSYLKHNTHVVAVDVGDSYERLCMLHKGTYLRYQEKDPISFNPFHVKNENMSIEKKESIITLIFTLWKKNPEDSSKDEYAILSESISRYYEEVENGDITQMSFNTYYEYMRDIYIPKINKTSAKDLFNSISFFNVLGMFYKGGEYDYLLNSELNVDLINEKFIVFELDNIKDHPILFPVVTLMIMDTFITKMRILKNTRKVILIEEAWKAITKEGMAEFMKYLYKTVRKHFGEAILVTQEVDDILGNEIIKDTIIKNCGAKILLDMREYANNFDSIQSMLSLTNKSKEQIFSINKNNIPGDKYKELFIGLGNEGSVFGVNLSKIEYATYTTEKKEKERIEELMEQYKDIETAITLYAEEIS